MDSLVDTVLCCQHHGKNEDVKELLVEKRGFERVYFNFYFILKNVKSGVQVFLQIIHDFLGLIFILILFFTWNH